MKRRSGTNGLRHLLRGTGALAATVLLVALGQNAAAQDVWPPAASAPPAVQVTPPVAGEKTVLGVACSQVQQLGIDKQTNLRAGAIRVGCGLEPGGSPAAASSKAPAPPALPGNVNTITGTETPPHVTQSESMVSSSDGLTIVVNMNDSRTAPSNYSGLSVSTDGGVTFTRLNPSPLATGHGTNFGDPIVVYNQKLGKWFAGDLATGCGGQGIGLWTSLDGLTWSVGACAHSGTSDDRESMTVDNNPSSPFYGRMYISWNDFAVSGGALYEMHSDDGVTWTSVLVVPSFIRDVQITVGPDGTMALAMMDEGGGGLVNMRTNKMAISTSGGAGGIIVTMGAAFLPPGDSLCSVNSYFAQITPIWRHMGWGQPGVGPNHVMHYAYAGKGVNSGDAGDIYYTRSTDNGSSWSTPIVLNTDQPAGGTKTQWMPSLSVTNGGDVLVHWYDRRHTTNGTNYEVYGRQSRDNGLTWDQDQPVSTVLIPQPTQPDPSVVSCYAGDYNYATTLGNMHYATWTDGRKSGDQDVFFAAVPTEPILCCGDFNGDGKADILWRNNVSGQVYEWQMNGATVIGGGSIGSPTATWAIVGIGDFDGDGHSDILWRNNSGDLYIWFMNGTTIVKQGTPGPTPTLPGGPDISWQIAGVGDFNGDGRADILWRSSDNQVYLWFMNGITVTSQAFVFTVTSPDWTIVKLGDFNGDGKTGDILWRHNISGQVYVYEMDGTAILGSASLGVVTTDWQIAGVGDFNKDGKSDVMWRNNSSGQVYEWQMNGLTIGGGGSLGVVSLDWQIAGIGDVNGDGFADVVWRNIPSGQTYIWELNGITVIGGGSPGVVSNDWQIE